MTRQPWRCTGCGGWRLYLNRPCWTCERIKVRHYIADPTGYWQGLVSR